MSATVNLEDARIRLPELVKALNNGTQDEIIISQDGKPAAKIIKAQDKPKQKVRLGLLEGQFADLDFEGFQALDADVLEIFGLDKA